MNEPDPGAMRDAQPLFERDGFLVVRDLCPPAVLDRMRCGAERDLAASRAPLEYEAQLAYPGAPSGRAAPGGRTVRRLLNALDRDPVFGEWACSPALTGRIRALLLTDAIRVVRAHHNCIMTKHPDYSSATGWHQDIRYWCFRRPDLINAWTALDSESRDNGGMCLIPGSHRAGFAAEAFDCERFFRPEHPANQAWIERAVQVDLGPGDVLFFHAALLHAAGRNRTARRKRAVVFSYRAADNPPLPDTRSAATADMDPERDSCA
ncbi:MAG: phytanoyl-CoA dioxygenase family protein [Wenzhouxiangellaceae bacterium]|nr:phytanoyl-CoA dioxygenase family protein [Wenzhouxiangellaceae bacterium]MBS3745957.1 phytanoyl-CoA dioxygenase family protein [Wenzhouxiangellaceae bacterium]MBS3823292.1 phytanoyl-CoA dioxygenase family protein [Wenzhouxiangellaceae bacterium]